MNRRVVRDRLVGLASAVPGLPVTCGSTLLDPGIVREACSAELVTLDIFDTVLFRPLITPDHAFELAFGSTGRATRLEAQARAEREAAAAGRGEVQLHEIHDQARALDPDWDVKRGLEAELDVERTLCRLNPHAVDVLRLLRRQSVLVGFVSDTYLPGPFVAELLGDVLGDSVLVVSSEFLVRKREGGLFDVASTTFGIPKRAWMHVGDTLTPDVIQPVRRRIRAGYVPRPIDQFRQAQPDLAARLTVQDSPMSTVAVGGVANEFALLSPEERRDFDAAAFLVDFGRDATGSGVAGQVARRSRARLLEVAAVQGSSGEAEAFLERAAG